MNKFLFPTLLAMLTIFIGCQKDTLPETPQVPTAPEVQQIVHEQYFAPFELSELGFRNSCWTEVPAGSVDALADAVANTCENGIIYLKSGMHTENEMVTITKSVKIIGEEGAVLMVKSDLALFDPVTESIPLNPAMHFLDAPGSLVQDLEIRPLDGDGATAVLFENSDASAVMRCEISNFQFAIVLEKSDRATLMLNIIVGTSKWLTGEVTDCYSIVCMNGKSAYISDNDLSNSIFGVWACDEWGTLERNETHDNGVGIILCNVPLGYLLPSGEVTGSEIPATGWKVNNNTSVNNFDNGIMIIDGSKSNKIWNNQVHNNGLASFAGTAADIETFNESELFGFTTPVVNDNYIDASSDPATTIRNCGNNNTFVGGTLIGGDCR